MTMTTYQPKIGDRVVVDHNRVRGQVWIVRKLNPANLRLESEDGRTQISAARELVQPVGERGVPLVTEVPIPTFYTLGDLVSVKGRNGVYVVLKPTPRGYSVALLGGDDDRYLNCPSAILSKIDADRRAAILTAASA